MKTKTRTFIAIVALGIIGFTNIDATAGNLDRNVYFAAEVEESLTIESWMLENDLFTESAKTMAEAEESLTIESWMLESDLFTESAKLKAEVAETEKALEIESWMTNENFFLEAESFTASGVDQAIEKYAARQAALLEERKSK